MSAGISNLLAVGRKLGLVSEEATWSEALVHHFNASMPDEIRAAGEADASLHYFRQDNDTHYALDEGFIDRAAKVAVSFLLEKRAEC